MSLSENFIIVDDDRVNNFICKEIIIAKIPGATVLDFADPEAALQYIGEKYSNGNNAQPVVLLLDINMPKMSGWDFLERFERFDDKVKSSVKVYIISSSIDSRDKERASTNPYVADYIVKPLADEFFKD